MQDTVLLFPAFRKFCHFLAGFVVSLFSATSYAAKSTVCSTMSADAADPRLRIRASIHWSCRTRTPCPRSVCPPIRRIQAAAYAARTDGGCRTRSAARPASAAPDHTIRNRWWATRSSSDRQPCLAKPPSAHQPRPFLAKPALFQRMRCGDHAPRKSQNSHAVPISRIHRCRHPGS